MKTKIFSMIIALVIIVGIAPNSFAYSPLSSSDEEAYITEISKINSAKIQSTLCSENTSRALTKTGISATLEYVKIEGASALIQGSTGSGNFNLSGQIFNSSKDNGNYVCVLTDLGDNYTVLFCGIGTNGLSSPLSKDASTNELFYLYLLDANNNLLIIEEYIDNLGIEMSDIQTNEQAEIIYDTMWFARVVAPVEESEVPNDDIPSLTRDTIRYTWTGSTYSKTYKIGKDTIVVSATPSYTGNIVDVGTSGSSNWTSTLKLNTNIKTNGVITDTTSLYKIKNAVVSIGGGNNSCMTSRMVGGSYAEKTNGTLNTNIKGIIGKVLNTTVSLSTVSTIYSWLSNITYDSSSTTLVTGNYANLTNSTGGYHHVASFKYDSNAYMNSSRHNMDFGVFVSTITSSLTKNVSTKAVIKWTFNLYYDLDLVTSLAPVKEVTYISNMSK